MSKKIAIIKEYNHYDNDYNEKLINSISDWSEVSDEEYKMLVSYQIKGNYTLIERIDSPEFIKKTVGDYLEWASAEEKRKMFLAEQRAKRKILKTTKKEEEERKLFEELSKKYAS